jgi:hypothetical protein
MQHSREHAEVLLRKAQQDEFALEKLAPDPASPDEIIGFHAQQAIEKSLMAVLECGSLLPLFFGELARPSTGLDCAASKLA